MRRKSGIQELTVLLGVVVGAPSVGWAGGVPTAVLEEVTVTGRLNRLQGNPVSASQGIVTDEQLDLRPVLRTGELMEVVPGLIVTQHSGDGKANQYFLRGFNPDHGTDLATSVDGVPVNMPTHGHGQGYTDINFVISELVQSIEYRKGTYYAETGNFSAAGAVNMRYRRKLDAPLVVLEGGQDSYLRGLLAGSPEIAGGTLLFGVDYAHIDGPWTLDENYNKRNALLRYSRTTDSAGQFSITAQSYNGGWRSTDQIPLRAVQSAEIGRFGTIDTSDGESPAERVDPLVKALGADVGLRTAIFQNLQLSASLWRLELDSELLFVGDAGTTEASRESERRGVEFSAIWNPLSWLIVDADLAWSRSRFTDADPAGDRIPGAVESVASLGVAVEHPSGWFGGARFRHFGEAPLIEDNSVRSDSTTLVNLEAGYRFAKKYRVSVAIYNVLDSEDSDITYFYESQLANEAAPVGDIHFRPVEPRTVRAMLSASF